VTPTEHRIAANGLEHRVLEWEARGAPTATALLLHGYMDAAGTWDLVAPTLADAGMRVLAPDMRGYGDGARAPRGSYYHFADYVADLADIADAAAPGERFVLVGHSMGGTIATLYAGAFPERVAKLVLVEGVGPPDHPHDVAPDRMRRWITDVRAVRARGDAKSVGTIEEAFRRLAMNHPGVDADVVRSRLVHLVRDLGDGKVAWRFDPLHRTTSPTLFLAKTFIEFAKRVACPTLFVGGGPNGFHPADEDARLAAFADATRVDITDAGHMVHWTKPDDLARVLVRFATGAAMS
jgi:pimeloyl-ACP methyl ester carboxylesterase